MLLKYNIGMKSLHFRNYLKNYLFDLEDFITLYDKHLHVFNYEKLNKLSEDESILQMNNKEIIINGNNLKIKQMTKQELLVIGNILKVEFKYE